MNRDLIIPVILAGGTGTRLWPLSRDSYPKQFLSLNPENNLSLLQNTLLRVKDKKIFNDPILICNEDHRFIIAEQMRQIGIKPNAIILEPYRRNTAPAITLSSLFCLGLGKNTTIIVLSSDHLIKNESKFIELIKLGSEYSKKGRLVTFGVNPDSPETGYGYIESEKILNDSSPKGENIKSFIEKPTLEEAKIMLEKKNYSWNSGIFLFKAETLLKEISKYNPEIIKCCKKSLKESNSDLDFIRVSKIPYKNCPNIAIDCAVMEKTSLGTVLPFDVGWSDIGSWTAVWHTSEKDKKGNVIKGNVLAKEIKDSFLRSETRLVVGLGFSDLIVIETADAVLVANKNYSQEVKKLVELLNEKKYKEGIENKKVYRPWGHYDLIENQLGWQIKKIEVNTGESISLQRHNHRSEHWIILKGTAMVEVDDLKKILTKNQSAYIPLGSKHRLSNPGNETLVLIEVQTGNYLGEDDIERFEDKYSRL